MAQSPDASPTSPGLHTEVVAAGSDFDLDEKGTKPLLGAGAHMPSELADCAAERPHETLENLEKKFAPYVRRDVYGPMGRGELPLLEKTLLAVAMVTLVPLRFVASVLVLVVYYLICRLCTAFYSDQNAVQGHGGREDFRNLVGWRRTLMVASGRACTRTMLFVFGFYWIQEIDRSLGDASQAAKSDMPGAIVSNHVSYVDILYHMSRSFPSFVAKRSVARLPLVGLISKCLGCIYVQRESKSSGFKGVSALVTERIQDVHQNKVGQMMLLFPEGTTTNGEYLLPFKTGAFLAKAPVVPVIVRYPYRRFSPAWDSMSGVRHVFLLLCQFVNYMEVIRLPLYYPSEQEREDPKLYASNVRKLMAAEGHLILSEIGLAEKRVYHTALDAMDVNRN